MALSRKRVNVGCGQAMEDDPVYVCEALQKLGVAKPIFQAPIGSIASPELAAAVSEAGAIGHLACTWRSPDQLEALFSSMRAAQETR